MTDTNYIKYGRQWKNSFEDDKILVSKYLQNQIKENCVFGIKADGCTNYEFKIENIKIGVQCANLPEDDDLYIVVTHENDDDDTTKLYSTEKFIGEVDIDYNNGDIIIDENCGEKIVVISSRFFDNQIHITKYDTLKYSTYAFSANNMILRNLETNRFYLQYDYHNPNLSMTRININDYKLSFIAN